MDFEIAFTASVAVVEALTSDPRRLFALRPRGLSPVKSKILERRVYTARIL